MNAHKPAPLNYDHLNAVLDDARERFLEREREKTGSAPSLLVKDSSQEKEGAL